MVKKYQKLPVVVDSVQWDGTNLEEMKEFVGENLIYSIMDAAWEVGKGIPHVLMKIKTLGGEIECYRGDYIIKGVDGEFYPCEPNIFSKTYIEVS